MLAGHRGARRARRRTRGGARRCRRWTGETALPAGYRDGWTFTTPVVEMPVYLRWLAAPGRGARRHPHPDEPARRCPDGRSWWSTAPGSAPGCSAGDRIGGAGARAGACCVEQVGLERWWLDAAGPTYVVPRSRDIVVGGTDDEGDWSRTPSPETARAILARAARLVPELAGARCCGTRWGCGRCGPPCASSARGRCVHCYGHGGAGVTLRWGAPTRSSGWSRQSELGADHRARCRSARRRAGTSSVPGRVLLPRRGEQVGVDLEQHQRLVDVGVERRPHALPLVGAAGVDEALLARGSGRGSTSCRRRLRWAAAQSAASAMWKIRIRTAGRLGSSRPRRAS